MSRGYKRLYLLNYQWIELLDLWVQKWYDLLLSYINYKIVLSFLLLALSPSEFGPTHIVWHLSFTACPSNQIIQQCQKLDIRELSESHLSNYFSYSNTLNPTIHFYFFWKTQTHDLNPIPNYMIKHLSLCTILFFYICPSVQAHTKRHMDMRVAHTSISMGQAVTLISPERSDVSYY